MPEAPPTPAGIILPKEVLAKLRVGLGDQLYLTEGPDGVRITAHDPDFAADMEMAEEIMREVRKGDDDWSTSAPPYRAPDPPKDGEKADEGKGSKEQDSQPKQEEKKDGESGNGELKGIELPPLDMARAPGKEASKQDEKQKQQYFAGSLPVIETPD